MTRLSRWSAWGVKLFNAGALGHINSDSDLGEWEQGRKFLAEFESTEVLK